MDIEVKNICKSFNGRKIYDHYSISFRGNSVNHLNGPSGCGKTTLMRMIMGLDKADSGEISGVPEKISVCFQEDRLVESLSCIENVMLVAESKDTRQAADEILAELGIDNTGKTTREFSGGQKRRISVARALVHNADLYIFDEPYAGLDESSRERTKNAIRKYTKGKTVIISGHQNDIS